MSDVLIPLTILIPFAGSLICFVSRHRVSVITGGVTACLTAITVGLLTRHITMHGVRIYAMGEWPAPLGIHLRADGLALFMMIMSAAVGVAVTFYAQAYFGQYKGEQEKRGAEMFWPIWLFLWAAMNALYLSADIFNIYVILEIIGLAGVGLMALTGRRAVLIAGMRYLLSAMAGSIVYLLGVVMLYSAYHTVDIQLLGQQLEPGTAAVAAMTVMLLGLLLKTAMFPLHFWLPPAHASAAAPVSAILSALVVKGSFYLILRLWFDVFQAVITIEAGQVLGVLGTGAILWGSIQALRQERVKMMIAYSTVAQLGYLLFVFPVSAVRDATDPSAWVTLAGQGSLYHALAHALAKTSIFLSAGVLLHAAGSDHIHQMRGLARRLPATVFAMALAGVSLMGLPPSGGFIAKWMTVQAVLAAGQWWWAPVIIGGGLLAAGYIFRVLRPAFLPPDSQEALHPVPRSLEICALLMAVLSIAIGLRAEDLLNVLHIGAPFALFSGGAL